MEYDVLAKLYDQAATEVDDIVGELVDFEYLLDEEQFNTLLYNDLIGKILFVRQLAVMLQEYEYEEDEE